jgi:hypothetical protein
LSSVVLEKWYEIKEIVLYLLFSVPDPGRFDTDLDPRIRTTGLRIRIRIFSSVTCKMPSKSNFFLQSFYLFKTYQRYIYINLKRRQVIKNSQNCRNSGGFLSVSAC